MNERRHPQTPQEREVEPHAGQIQDFRLQRQARAHPDAGHARHNRQPAQHRREENRCLITACAQSDREVILFAERRGRAQEAARDRIGQQQDRASGRRHPQLTRRLVRPRKVRQRHERHEVHRVNPFHAPGHHTPPRAQQVEAVEQQPVRQKQGLRLLQGRSGVAPRDTGQIGRRQSEQRHRVPLVSGGKPEDRSRQGNQTHHRERTRRGGGKRRECCKIRHTRNRLRTISQRVRDHSARYSQHDHRTDQRIFDDSCRRQRPRRVRRRVQPRPARADQPPREHPIAIAPLHHDSRSQHRNADQQRDTGASPGAHVGERKTQEQRNPDHQNQRAQLV